ncbi:hypothetical protein [Cuniculiplasma divulgatum]|uniref:Uncharacterized protein n=1 Tax=Cuniculiplasma divulgatum TaxID=1673428 RepID=A0A1N5TMW0_9ARCH|nr:hypothetical protein [Cuniculiplasma divulgatum]SIM49395.1 hypothetical protein CSP5_0618 [Cuniculiplasma divulgatum]
MKISENGAETIRRILNNPLTYCFVWILVWAGKKIFKDEVNYNEI